MQLIQVMSGGQEGFLKTNLTDQREPEFLLGGR